MERTLLVCGSYWISSKTSFRCTTAPGVTAMFSPTSNSEVSTMFGMRGRLDMSDTNRRAPFTKLSPPESIVALSTAGLVAGKLLGATRSTRFSAAKRTRRSSAQSSPASASTPSIVSPVAR